MDSNLVTAASAVLGSMVGASASLASTWFTQRYQFRRDNVSRQITRRETLYSEFIIEAARLYSEAFVNNIEDPHAMATLWGLLARIRLSATESVLVAAEKVFVGVGDQFMASKLKPEEIRDVLIKSDPLKELTDVCRVELDVFDVSR